MGTISIGDSSLWEYGWSEETTETINAISARSTNESYTFTSIAPKQEVDDVGQCTKIKYNDGACFKVDVHEDPCSTIDVVEEEPYIPEELDFTPFGISQIKAIHAVSVGSLYMYCKYNDVWSIVEALFTGSFNGGITKITNIFRHKDVSTNWFGKVHTADGSEISSIIGVSNDSNGDFLALVHSFPDNAIHNFYTFDLLTFDSPIADQDLRSIGTDGYTNSYGFIPNGTFCIGSSWVDRLSSGCGGLPYTPNKKLLGYDKNGDLIKSNLPALLYAWDTYENQSRVLTCYESTWGDHYVICASGTGDWELQYARQVDIYEAPNKDECIWEFQEGQQPIKVLPGWDQMKKSLFNTWYFGIVFHSTQANDNDYKIFFSDYRESWVKDVPTNAIDTSMTGFFVLHCTGSATIIQETVKTNQN